MHTKVNASTKASFELRFTDPKQKIQVEVQGNNLNFFMFYTPHPRLHSFVWEQQSITQN